MKKVFPGIFAGRNSHKYYKYKQKSQEIKLKMKYRTGFFRNRR